MDKKFIYDPALKNEFIAEVFERRFPEFETGWEMGHPKVKRNVFHQVLVWIKPHKDKKKGDIDYIRVFTQQYYSAGLAVLMGYLPFFIIQGVTKGSFYDDVDSVLTEELNARFHSIE